MFIPQSLASYTVQIAPQSTLARAGRRGESFFFSISPWKVTHNVLKILFCFLSFEGGWRFSRLTLLSRWEGGLFFCFGFWELDWIIFLFGSFQPLVLCTCVYVESVVCNRSAAPFSFESLRIGCKGNGGEPSLYMRQFLFVRESNEMSINKLLSTMQSFSLDLCRLWSVLFIWTPATCLAYLLALRCISRTLPSVLVQELCQHVAVILPR